jgi:hypothetical protein
MTRNAEFVRARCQKKEVDPACHCAHGTSLVHHRWVWDLFQDHVCAHSVRALFMACVRTDRRLSTRRPTGFLRLLRYLGRPRDRPAYAQLDTPAVRHGSRAGHSPAGTSLECVPRRRTPRNLGCLPRSAVFLWSSKRSH